MTEGVEARTPPLRTDRLKLTPLDPAADAEHLHSAYGDEEVMRWWPSPRCADVAETSSFLAACAGQSGARLWTVRGPDGQVLGMAGLLGEVSVPGLTWLLRKDAWGHGYATEAARAVAGHALGELDLDRVEAWVEATNHRSLAVAARIGLTERARLSQRYAHRGSPHEVVVLGRAREPEVTRVLECVAVLPVRDVSATLRLLNAALGSHTAFTVGDPPYLAEVSLTPWSAGPRFRLEAVPRTRVRPVALQLECAAELDALHRAAAGAGARVSGPPAEQPWGRREFTLKLREGHRLTLSAPA